MASTDREIVVVTAASGKQNKFMIPILLQNPRFKLRLIVNSSSSVSRLQDTYSDEENVEVLQANLQDYNSCASILKGATTVYHINPNHPKEAEIGINMVTAAVTEKKRPDSKFQHFVLSTVFCTQISKMLNHARKLKVEEYLIDRAAPNTGALNWTIIQPGHLAEALVARLVTAMKENPGKDKVPFENQFDVEVPFSYLSLRDLGEASAKVVEERSKHYFATYGLSSTHPMPYKDFIQQIGKKLNVEFDITVLPHEKAVDANCISAFRTTDVDQATRDGPERLVLYYNKRGLLGNPNICSWLLGREPTKPEDMVDNV
ncbi:hypothetical protein ES702_03611 [subsurface metagenome]